MEELISALCKFNKQDASAQSNYKHLQDAQQHLS